MTSEPADPEAAFLAAGHSTFSAEGWKPASSCNGSLLAFPGRFVLPVGDADLFWAGELEIYGEDDGLWLAAGVLGVTSAPVEALLAHLSHTSKNASIAEKIVLAPNADADIPVRSIEEATRTGREVAGEICRRASRVDPIVDLDSYIAAAEANPELYREILPVALVVAGRLDAALELVDRVGQADRDVQYQGFARRLTEHIRSS